MTNRAHHAGAPRRGLGQHQNLAVARGEAGGQHGRIDASEYASMHAFAALFLLLGRAKEPHPKPKKKKKKKRERFAGGHGGPGVLHLWHCVRANKTKDSQPCPHAGARRRLCPAILLAPAAADNGLALGSTTVEMKNAGAGAAAACARPGWRDGGSRQARRMQAGLVAAPYAPRTRPGVSKTCLWGFEKKKKLGPQKYTSKKFSVRAKKYQSSIFSSFLFFCFSKE